MCEYAYASESSGAIYTAAVSMTRDPVDVETIESVESDADDPPLGIAPVGVLTAFALLKMGEGTDGSSVASDE